MNYNLRDTALFVPRRAVARLRSSRLVSFGSNSFYRVSLKKNSDVHLTLAVPLACPCSREELLRVESSLFCLNMYVL
jgi:hypothetical protein